MDTQIRLQIVNREPFANGALFGDVGSYECISGTVLFSVNPENPTNASIVDLNLAPTNSEGLVEFSTDFYMLKPLFLDRGNGTLIYDVNNRGNKRLLQFMNDAVHSNKPMLAEHAGNGYLMRRGYSIVWSGWQGDLSSGDHRLTMHLPIPSHNSQPIKGLVRSEFIVDTQDVFSLPLSGNSYTDSYSTASLDTSSASLTYREYEEDERIPIKPAEWIFGYQETDGQIVPSDQHCYLRSGFKPGLIYELIYTAINPPVLGLGFLGVRDLIWFLKSEKADANQIPNPLYSKDAPVERAYAWGRSQSGRFLREFVYQGYNAASNQQKVFDGIFPHVAGGGRVCLNYRFAQPGRFPLKHAEHLYPSDQFPFAYSVLTDPFSDIEDGILKRPETDPLVIHTQTSSEYWDRRGSLVHTDFNGNALPENEKARVFLFASSQHFADPLPGNLDPLVAEIAGHTRYKPNPLNSTPLLRALLDRLDQWVRKETSPPSSRVPVLSDESAVKANQIRDKFPSIPGVFCSFLINRVHFQDHGSNFKEGILEQEPPIELLDKEYPIYVSQVDDDGNEIAGIRTPDVTVALATYTGWNMRLPGYAENAPTGTTGSYFPFSLSKAERLANADPRLSVQERFSSKDQYIKAVVQAARELHKDGLLLQEDVDRYIASARKTPIFDTL